MQMEINYNGSEYKLTPFSISTKEKKKRTVKKKETQCFSIMVGKDETVQKLLISL